MTTPGLHAMNLLYDYSSNVAEPPTSNQVRFNAGAPYSGVSKLWFRYVTADGIDAHTGLMAVAIGTTIYIQDKNDHTAFATFDSTGAPIDKTGYVEIPVTSVSSGGSLSNNQQVVVAAVPASSSDTPVPSGGPFVTIQEAKDHLRITTPPGHPDDVDIQAKLDAAQAILLDYCNTTAVWRDITVTWTAATVPLPVKQAILLELGELMRFRGDDVDVPARETETDLSPMIVGLLRRSRDPVVA